jgi:hypothetical protein
MAFPRQLVASGGNCLRVFLRFLTLSDLRLLADDYNHGVGCTNSASRAKAAISSGIVFVHPTRNHGLSRQ